MRFTPRTWSLLSIMLFVAAVFFWLKGNEVRDQRRQGAPPPAATNGGGAPMTLLTPGSAGLPLAALDPSRVSGSAGALASAASPASNQAEPAVHPYRLRNTEQGIQELSRHDAAILMANAFIDTGAEPPVVPDQLRNEADPGTYIVQWSGPADARFRSILAEMDARIVSYVPNNAYLVRVDGPAAEELRLAPGIQAVLPYEPYYKLDSRLLQAAVEGDPLDAAMALRVTFFADASEAGLAEVRGLHAEVLAEESSPFGPQAVVRPPVTALAEIARLTSVQAIEPVFPRRLANDLTRVAVGVSPDPVTNRTYMDLSGSNIWVNINDTGLDTTHAALDGRVTLGHPSMGQGNDPDGHGTFVAAILAGDGDDGPGGAPGSITNASYRGIAPEARIFALPLESGPAVNPHVLDSYLYETAARTNYLTLSRTNTLISNNSWNYLGAAEYDSSAARYDAAVRDSIPGESGDQPVLFVFAAGNGGFGGMDGFGGEPNGIYSPATAKNVITVGALEHPRFIEVGYTNITLVTNNPGPDQIIITNEEVIFPYFELTDSGDQVASYSSRGNVGIGTEGFYGRFKPDVVAPGTMIVSARSEGWDINDQVDTNAQPGETFAALNAPLGEYRIDSGTTFAAPVVSGLLALLQEFYEERAPDELRRESLSPALMKAILINGARSLSSNYDLQVQSFINYQGWGLPNIQRSIPTNLTVADEKKWSMRLIEQSPTNALSTGESLTWRVTLSTNAAAFPLRATLVWTDPPGNPAVAVKLVNDLDLVVTNLDTGAVFFGNNIPGGTDFTQGLDPENTPGYNPSLFLDYVNNVENVLIREPRNFGREFSITVRAKRINVDSVADFHEEVGTRLRELRDVVQDFALVISSDVMLEDQDVFEEFNSPSNPTAPIRMPLTVVTNGLPLLEQRAGAVHTLLAGQGATNQWSFYVFTNTFIENSFVSITNGTNIAFITFNPPTLSRPRTVEADVDMYVSTNPQLTNLAPAVLNSALRSVTRDGTEMVVMTNGVLGQVYYVAIKSESQQGAEFSLMGLSTDLPLEEERDGQRILRGFPFSSFIPDGSPRRPGGTTVMAIGLSNTRVQRVVATNIISHENMGDLVGVLTHNNIDAVLNNHNLGGSFFATNVFVYDDSFTPLPESVPTDGPGSLNSFAGQRIVGPWMLQMIDNAPGYTGRVELLTLVIDPLPDNLLPGVTVSGTVTNTIVYYPIDVPPGVTNLTFRLGVPQGQVLHAYLRRDGLPTPNEYDLAVTNNAGSTGIEFSYPTADSDPLVAGTYFIGLYNPNPAIAVNFNLTMFFEYGFDPENESRNTLPGFDVDDHASSSSVIDLRDDKVVTTIEVGVRMDHPRTSDTELHLVTPQGTRLLLSDHRGGALPFSFGTDLIFTNEAGVLITNIGYTYFTEDTNLTDVPIKFAMPPYSVPPSNFGVIFTNSFENAQANNYMSGTTVDGWQVGGSPLTTNGQTILPMVSIITSGNLAHSGTNLLSLGSGRVQRTLDLEEGRSYQLRFAYRTSDPLNLMSTGLDVNGEPLDGSEIDPHYQLFTSADPAFPGPEAYVLNWYIGGMPFVPGWDMNTTNSQWITPFPHYTNLTTAHVPGTYVYRTYLSMYGLDTRTAQVRFKWTADDSGGVYFGNSTQNIPPTDTATFNSVTNFGTISGFRQGLNILDFNVTNAPNTFRSIGMRLEVDQALPVRDLSQSSMRVVFNGQTNNLPSSRNGP